MNNFNEEKSILLSKLKEFTEAYDNFTKKISPSFWRITGTHFTNLREMEKDVIEFTEVTEKEKQNEYYKEAFKDK